MADPFQLLSLGVSLLGGRKKAKGIKESGRRAMERGREQRVFNETAATQVIAMGQRAALEETRQAKLTASRAVAVAAAGGSVQDISHLLADIEGEGAYRAHIAMWEAETEAERLIFEGKQAEKYGMDVYKEAGRQAKGVRLASLGSIFNSGLLDGPWGTGGGSTSSSGARAIPLPD